MGNRGRIAKGLKQGVAISETGIFIDGCAVLVGHPDGDHASVVSKSFAKDLSHVLAKSKEPSMRDLITGRFDMQGLLN